MTYGKDEYQKTEYMGQGNITEDVWTLGRIRNLENMNYSGILGAK
jgi:hypothetical protein